MSLSIINLKKLKKVVDELNINCLNKYYDGIQLWTVNNVFINKVCYKWIQGKHEYDNLCEHCQIILEVLHDSLERKKYIAMHGNFGYMTYLISHPLQFHYEL